MPLKSFGTRGRSCAFSVYGGIGSILAGPCFSNSHDPCIAFFWMCIITQVSWLVQIAGMECRMQERARILDSVNASRGAEVTF